MVEAVLKLSHSGLFTFEAGIEETDCSTRNPSYTLGMVIGTSL